MRCTADVLETCVKFGMVLGMVQLQRGLVFKSFESDLFPDDQISTFQAMILSFRPLSFRSVVFNYNLARCGE